MISNIVQDIKELNLNKSTLEEIVKICQDRIWEMERDERIRILQEEIAMLKIQPRVPKEIGEVGDDYLNR